MGCSAGARKERDTTEHTRDWLLLLLLLLRSSASLLRNSIRLPALREREGRARLDVPVLRRNENWTLEPLSSSSSSFHSACLQLDCVWSTAFCLHRALRHFFLSCCHTRLRTHRRLNVDLTRKLDFIVLEPDAFLSQSSASTTDTLSSLQSVVCVYVCLCLRVRERERESCSHCPLSLQQAQCTVRVEKNTNNSVPENLRTAG